MILSHCPKTLMNQDLQATNQTMEISNNQMERKPKTPLSVQTFGQQLTRIEKLLRNCGDKERQKLLLETLLQSY
jgi:hypothetical protein